MFLEQSGLVLLHSQRFQTYQNIYVFFTMMLQQRVISTTRCIMMLFSGTCGKTLFFFVVAVVVYFPPPPPLPLFFWQMFGVLIFFFSGYQVEGAYILVCLFAARHMSGLLRMPWSFWVAVGFSTAAIYWHCFADCSQGLVMSTNRQEGFEQIIHIVRITEIDLDCFSK